MTDRLSLV